MARALDHMDVQVVLRATYDERPETEAELEELLREVLEVMPPSEANEFLRAVRRTVKATHNAEISPEVRAFLDGVVDLEREDPSEAVEFINAGVARDFARRRQVLADSFGVAEAVDLLGITRQAVTGRWKKGKLLGFLANESLRLPTWQFDAEQRDGVVAGLPAVLEALRGSQLSLLNQIYWLTTSQPQFGGKTPIEALREDGLVAEVASHAAGAGTW